jgi:flagellar FliL protein
MAAEVEAGEGATRKKGPPKLILIAGAAALVVALGGAGLYYFLSSGSSAESADSHATAATPTFIFNLPPMTVNLSNETGGESFMRLSIALEVANQDVMTAIQPSLAKVTDAFQVYLRELRKSDLEGSAGIYRLKEELTRRVNVAIYPQRVESILFKEILVQ